MDWVLIIGVVAGAIGIVAGIVQVLDYMEKKRESEPGGKEENTLTSEVKPKAPKPSIPNNLPPRGEFIGRQREKAQVREALASRSFLVTVDGIGGTRQTLIMIPGKRLSYVSRDCL